MNTAAPSVNTAETVMVNLLGAANKAEAMDLLRRVPGVKPSRTLAAWLKELYPPIRAEEWLGSLEPDRLAELHVTCELDKQADLASACLMDLNERQARRALLRLAKASAEYDAARRLLEGALSRFEILPRIDVLVAIVHAIPDLSLTLAEARIDIITRISKTLPPRGPQRAIWLVTNSELLLRRERSYSA